MNNILKISSLMTLSLFFLAGCQSLSKISDYTTGKVQIEQKKQADKTLASVQCQQLCQNKIADDSQDFNIGPCLSESIIPDWVCDIAHSPRQPIDNDPRNQCATFRNGTTHHFVEVDGNCNLIQAQ